MNQSEARAGFWIAFGVVSVPFCLFGAIVEYLGGDILRAVMWAAGAVIELIVLILSIRRARLIR